MQLHSKMRYISAQFDCYLTDDLWKKNALSANTMAQKLAVSLGQFPAMEITQDVRANGIFVLMPEALIAQLQPHYFFHVWNENPKGKPRQKEVRLMCSWDTTEKDIEGFVNLVKQHLQ
jgi:threonine aldolase